MLIKQGHDVVTAAEIGPGTPDDVLLAQAAQEQRVLITADKDFGELVFVHRMPHAGIVRLTDMCRTSVLWYWDSSASPASMQPSTLTSPGKRPTPAPSTPTPRGRCATSIAGSERLRVEREELSDDA